MAPCATPLSHASTFTYDSAGNRLTAKKDGVLTTFSYDLADQLTTSVVGSTTTTFTFTYDNAGNQTLQVVAPNTRTTYTWNDDNRQTRVQATGVDLTAKYRFDGLRYEKAASGATTRFVFDGQNYLLETNTSGVVQAAYTGEPRTYGKLLSRRASSASRYYHFDGLCSTRTITNSSQSPTDAYMYDAWGVPIVTLGSTTNPFRWVGGVGYYYDPETGLYYVRASVYSSATARWMSMDRLRRERLYRPYWYAASRPTSVIDASGLIEQQVPYAPHWPSIAISNNAPVCCLPTRSLCIHVEQVRAGSSAEALIRRHIACANRALRQNNCCVQITLESFYMWNDNDREAAYGDTEPIDTMGPVGTPANDLKSITGLRARDTKCVPVFIAPTTQEQADGKTFSPLNGYPRPTAPAVFIFPGGMGDVCGYTLLHELFHIYLGAGHVDDGADQEAVIYDPNNIMVSGDKNTRTMGISRHQCSAMWTGLR